LFEERRAIEAQVIADPALGVLDFAVHVFGSQADEACGKLDQQRFDTFIFIQ